MSAIADALVEGEQSLVTTPCERGSSHPIGATVVPEGVNFSVFSRSAMSVELLLFDREDDARPARVIPIDPLTNRTYPYWHAFVPGLRPGQIYGIRANGPFGLERGCRFDPSKLLLDPYGRALVVRKKYSRGAASQEGDNIATAMKSVVVDPHDSDWEGDTPLRRPSTRTIIYEMHLSGFTARPNSSVAPAKRGSYAGLVEKIPYLQNLGITAVELLPVFQFDAQDCPLRRINYWGYAPFSFFAPHQAYSSRQEPLGPVDEFRDMVKAPVTPMDLSWQTPPVLWDFESEPVLAGTKMIAEAWDAAGLYQVGSFVGNRWKEWNGRFRDDGRSFFRAECDSVARAADRFLGSPAIYGHEDREEEQSVDFVTCHDGFTLNDLVSYNSKHNQENEWNRDGADDNSSWNCCAEGPSGDPAVERLRNRQVKNFLTFILFSLGLPMILMGDEVRRTQRGSNNAYCRDDEISWFDWSLVDKHADLHRFVKLPIARRLRRNLDSDHPGSTLMELLRTARHAWHGVNLGRPDWGWWSHSVAFGELPAERRRFPMILNAYHEPLDFELPALQGRHSWCRWIDTALYSPNDIVEWRAASPFSGKTCDAGPSSVVALIEGSDIE